jgi:hypothetical protein
MGIPFTGDTLRKASLGGSESAAAYLARELVRAGHRVNVWTTEPNSAGMYDGVRYTHIGNVNEQTQLGHQFEYYATHIPCDVLIIQRHPAAFNKKFTAKLCIWQTHDLALLRYGGMATTASWQMDVVTCVSEFHRQQTLEVYSGFRPELVKVVPNGVDETLYDQYPDHTEVIVERIDDPEIKLGCTAPHTITIRDSWLNMLFQSRPERGLSNALDTMDALAREGIKAHLYFCTYDGAAPQMQAFYESL